MKHTSSQLDRNINKTASGATDFQSLFNNTYWGNFILARNPDITPAIIANRNRFAEEWRIKARSHALLPRQTILGGVDYDHPELYKDADGFFVLLVSNYGNVKPPKVLALRMTPPLYCEGATSYAGRFATLRELRARLEASEGAPKFGAARHLFA